MSLRRRRPWLAEAISIVALMLLPLLFGWRLWALDPADRAAVPRGDFTDQYYPLQLFAARELAAGRLPAWDPYINAGQPGLADIQTGTFYPLNLLANLLLIVLGVPFSLDVLTMQIILHFSLASLFTYLFARHLTRRAGARIPAARFAGAVAALTFTYSGYLTSFPVQQLTILQTAIWLPLVLLFVDRAYHHPHPRPQILMAGLARDPTEAGMIFEQMKAEHGDEVFQYIQLELRRKRTKTFKERLWMLLRRALGEGEPRKYERRRPVEPIVKTNYVQRHD